MAYNFISMGNAPTFQSSGNAGQDISQLQQLASQSQGYMGPNHYMAGSQAAGFGTQAATLEQQRSTDPWSFYRGDAADRLAGQAGQTSPSNFYTTKLQQMATGDFTPDDPSYKWRFEQGQQAVERSLGAKGLLNSGNAAIELQQYGQGAASQEYGAQFQRIMQAMTASEGVYDQQQSRLMELAGVRNVGAGIQKQNLDQSIADNMNEQMGLAAAHQEANSHSYNPGFGSGALG